MARVGLRERFDAKVSPEPMSGCLLWTGCIDAKGYGLIGVAGRSTGAHRVAWILARGPIPDGLWVLHHCDNPACVNAEGGHLFLGTNLDNIRDRNAKGRNPNARKTHCAKGHPYSGANLMRHSARGARLCRTCHLAWKRGHWARSGAARRRTQRRSR